MRQPQPRLFGVVFAPIAGQFVSGLGQHSLAAPVIRRNREHAPGLEGENARNLMFHLPHHRLNVEGQPGAGAKIRLRNRAARVDDLEAAPMKQHAIRRTHQHPHMRGHGEHRLAQDSAHETCHKTSEGGLA
jgi:hypothetical protein